MDGKVNPEVALAHRSVAVWPQKYAKGAYIAVSIDVTWLRPVNIAVSIN
jgi:hypothetical protein